MGQVSFSHNFARVETDLGEQLIISIAFFKLVNLEKEDKKIASYNILLLLF